MIQRLVELTTYMTISGVASGVVSAKRVKDEACDCDAVDKTLVDWLASVVLLSIDR